MNWLDISLAAILLFSFARAFWNGITREFIGIVALVAGIVCGMWWYRDVARHFLPYLKEPSLSSFAGFVTIVVGAVMAGGIIARLMARVLHWSGLRWFDRLLGGAFGLVRGLLAATALVLAVVSFSPTTGSSETVANSRVAPWVLHGARWTAAFAPETLRAAFYQGFDQVRAAWTEAEPAPQPKTLVKNHELPSPLRQ